MNNSNTKQEEDWGKECSEVPLCDTSANRPVLTKSFGRPRGLSRVFYNQRLNNNLRNDADHKRGKQDAIHRRTYKNSSSDSSDGNGKEEGNYVNEHLRNQKEPVYSEFNQSLHCGREQISAQDDKNNPHVRQDQFGKERDDDFEQSQQFEEKIHNEMHYQMCERSSPLMAVEQESTKSVQIASNPKSSESESQSSMTTVTKDDHDQHLLASTPNFWKDRHAFVSEARPVTEDEEAEMIRRALELSRIEDEERQKKEMEEENLYMSLLMTSSSSLEQVEGLVQSTTKDTDLNVIGRSRDEFSVEECNPGVLPGDDFAPPALGVQDPLFCETQKSVGESNLIESEDASKADEVTAVNFSSPRHCSASIVRHTPEEDSEFSDWMNNFARDSAVDVSFFPNGCVLDVLPQVIYQEVELNSSASHNPPDVIYQVPTDQESRESCRPEVVYFEGVCVSPARVTPLYVVEDDPVLAPQDEIQPVSDNTDLVSCSSVHYMPSQSDEFNRYSPLPSSDVCLSPSQCSSPGPVYIVDSGAMQFANPSVVPMPMCSYPPSWLGYQMVPAPSFNPMAMCGGYPQYANVMPAGPYGFTPGLVMPTTYPPPGIMPPPGLMPAPVAYPGFPATPPVWFPHPHGMPVPSYQFVSGAPMSPMFSMAPVEACVEQKGLESG